MCWPVVAAVVGTIVSTTVSIQAARVQAQAQERANARAAQQAADQASAKNAAANLAARQEAAVETRQRFEVERSREEAISSNVAEFSQAGVGGNFLRDVSQSVHMSADEAQSSLTVQNMFAQQSRELGGTFTELARINTISNLPRGGSAGLAITQGVMGGIQTGINLGTSVQNSGLFK